MFLGRAWRPEELRIKSFADLHKLWFVLLKEKNLLYTQEAESRKQKQPWMGQSRLIKVSKENEN